MRAVAAVFVFAALLLAVGGGDPANAPLRATLPWWAKTALVSAIATPFATSFLATFVAACIASAGARMRGEMHWTERARRLAPSRYAGQSVPIIAAVATAITAAGETGLVRTTPAGIAALAAGFAALIGGALAWQLLAPSWMERPAHRLRDAWGQFAQAVVLAPQLFVFAITAFLSTGRTDEQVALVGGGSALLLVAVSFWAGIPFARALGVQIANSPRAVAAAARASEGAGTRPPRRIVTLALPMANAWALPLSRWIGVTQRLVDELDDAQIEAVMAHELAHLDESRGVIAARVAVTFVWLPLGLLPAIRDRYGSVGYWVTLACLVGALLGSRGFVRRKESDADRRAHELEHGDGVYASALERLYEVNLAPAVNFTKRATHPDLYDRMVSAGLSPVYPRPSRPSRLRIVAGFAGGMLVIIAADVGRRVSAWWLPVLLPSHESVALGAIALDGGSVDSVLRLAAARANGPPEPVHAAIDAVLAREPGRSIPYSLRAKLLADAGDCAGAFVAIDAAWEHAATANDEEWAEGADRQIGSCLDD